MNRKNVFLTATLLLIGYSFSYLMGVQPQATYAQESVIALNRTLVPSQNGSELTIIAGTAEVGGPERLYAQLIGPSHHMGGAGTEDPAQLIDKQTDGSLTILTVGLSPSQNGEYLSTLIGLPAFTPYGGRIGAAPTLEALDDITPDPFVVNYIPPSAQMTFTSEDGLAELQMLNVNTLTSANSIAIVSVGGFFGSVPDGHRFVGQNYDFNVEGEVSSNRPMNLRLFYNPDLLQTSRQSLAIFWWDKSATDWVKLESIPSAIGNYVSVSTRNFGGYALLETNRWLDEFDTYGGIERYSGATIQNYDNDNALVMTGESGTSLVTSTLITSFNLLHWDSLTYTAVFTPPTTTLQIDILDPDSQMVITDAQAGLNLTEIDPTYTTLKLRATLRSTAAGITPRLYNWGLQWQTKETETQIYLPLVRR